MNTIENSQLLSSGFLQRIDFFKDLSLELKNKLLENNKLLTTCNKQNIFEQGEKADHFGFVIQGMYSLAKVNSDEQRTILDFVAPGGMVGGLLMSMPETVYPVTVQSIGTGQFLAISKDTFKKHWINNGIVMQKMQIANLDRVNALQAMRETQRFSMEKKIAWVLLKLLSGSQDENHQLKLNIFRRDLGDAAGVSTESIIRTFTQWTQNGIVKNDGSNEFVDLEQLQKKYF